MPWAGNIAKAMTSKGKQFTVNRSTVHCWPLLHLMAGISVRFSNFAFVLFCYITNHLMTGPLWNSEFCVPRISMFPETKFSGNKIHFSPRDQSLTVNYGLTVSVHLVKYCYWPLPVIPLGNNKKVIECTTLDYDRTSKNKNYSTINHYSITNSCTFSVYSPNKCCITQQLYFFKKHIWSLCVDEISWSCSIPKYIVLGPNHKFSLPFYST